MFEWKGFRSDDVRIMVVEADTPETDCEQVVGDVGNKLRRQREGNILLYGLRLEDLDGIK